MTEKKTNKRSEITYKDLSRQEKLEYLWTYYKWPALLVLAVVLVIGFTIWNNARKDKRQVVADVLLVGSLEPESGLFDDLIPALGYSRRGEKYGVVETFSFSREGDNSRQSQYVSVMLLMRDVDVMAAPEDVFAYYAGSGAFRDLAGLLPPALLEKYEDLAWTVTNEETGETVLCGFRLGADTPLLREGYFVSPVLCGVVANSDDFTADIRLLAALLGEDPADWAEYYLPEDADIYR